MSDTQLQRPFVAFNFSVEITVGDDQDPLCAASFSECDGLEMTMEVKTLREGGNNGRQIRLAGALSFGQLVLKRGVTDDYDLWDWFQRAFDDPSLRATTEVVILPADVEDSTPSKRFVLEGCIPVKIKAPPLNAKDGLVAIEEMQIAYESLAVKKDGTPGAA